MSSKNYKVILKNDFDNQDRKIMTMLYLPIIGSEALSLYFSLLNDGELSLQDDKIVFDFDHLIASISIDDNKLEIIRKKLEGTKLLDTYKDSKKEEYIFNLFSPLSADDFFKTHFLNNTLFSRVGLNEYEKIRYVFRDRGCVISDSFENVTTNFNEIFGSEISYPNFESQISFNTLKSKNKFLFSEVEINELKQIFIKNDIQINLNDSNILNNIFELKQIFGLNMYETVECLKLSINYSDGKVSRKRFCDEATKLKESLLKLIDKSEDSIDIRNIKENQKLIELEKFSSDLYLKAIKKQNFLSPDDIDLLNILKKDYKLHDSVINTLIEFSFYKNDKKIVFNYIKKIAQSMSANNINNAKNAMSYLKNAFKNTGRFQKSSFVSKNNSQQIDWTNDQFEDEVLKNHELNENNIDEFLRKLD